MREIRFVNTQEAEMWPDLLNVPAILSMTDQSKQAWRIRGSTLINPTDLKTNGLESVHQLGAV